MNFCLQTASKKDENELLQLKGQVLQLTLQLTNEQAARINSEGENKDLQEKLQKTMEEVAAIKNSAGDASQLKTVADRLFAEMEHARTRRKSADFAALEQKIETALSVAEEKTRLTFEVSNLNAQIEELQEKLDLAEQQRYDADLACQVLRNSLDDAKASADEKAAALSGKISELEQEISSLNAVLGEKEELLNKAKLELEQKVAELEEKIANFEQLLKVSLPSTVGVSSTARSV